MARISVKGDRDVAYTGYIQPSIIHTVYYCTWRLRKWIGFTRRTPGCNGKVCFPKGDLP